MSRLLGVLSLTGKGGAHLFVFDDALVRATTGASLAAALLRHNATAHKPGLLGASLATALAGDLGAYATMSPEQIAAENPSNQGVWVRDLSAAVLAPGRWPSTGLRRLTVTLRMGETRTYEWPGDGATRPLNRDADAVPLLSYALGDLLEVHVGRRQA
jgi:hypothetical protein